MGLIAQTGASATLSILLLIGGISARGVIKGGVYKIESLSDHSVLTATWTGTPREVITDEWREGSLQEWRVRLNNDFGESAYILRNEFVKDNEVNKEVMPGTEGHGRSGKGDLVVAKWTLSPVDGHELTFVISKAGGCLQNNGSGQRISIALCNSAATNQQWEFEFLFDKQD